MRITPELQTALERLKATTGISINRMANDALEVYVQEHSGKANAAPQPETWERASGTLGTATDGEAWSAPPGVWGIGSGEKAQGED